MYEKTASRLLNCGSVNGEGCTGQAVMSKNVSEKFFSQTFTCIPLLLLFLQQGLIVTKVQRCVECIPNKNFNSFLQSAVDARRQIDENHISCVVAETMKLLAKKSNGFQVLDRSRHCNEVFQRRKNTCSH